MNKLKFCRQLVCFLFCIVLATQSHVLLARKYEITPPADTTAHEQFAMSFSAIGEDISNYSFTNIERGNLPPPKLMGANCSYSDFSGLDMSDGDFEGADLTGAYFLESDLSRANLRGAKLDGAKFVKTILTDVDIITWSEHPVENANFNAANLQGATFIVRGGFHNSTFLFTYFQNAYIDSTDFGNADLSMARFSGTDFYSSDYHYPLNFKKANFANSVFKDGSGTATFHMDDSVRNKAFGRSCFYNTLWIDNQTHNKHPWGPWEKINNVVQKGHI